MKKSQHGRIQRVCRNTRRREHYEVSAVARNFRLALVGVVFSTFALSIVVRLFWLQGPQHERWAKLARGQHQGKMAILGARGTIFDRMQRTLATSAETLSVGVHPRLLKNKENAGLEIAKLLEMDSQVVTEKINSQKSFVWLKKGVPTTKQAALRKISARGLSLQKEFSRFYPQGEIASSFLGRVGVDGDGLSGIELAFNEKLKANKTERKVRRDALGNLFTPTSLVQDANADTGSQVRQEGSKVVLTIDAVLQSILEKEVVRGRLNAEAKGVYAALMDAETGEVLAATQDIAGGQNSSGVSRLRNGILQNVYEPGSTFKPLVAAIALDGGYVREDELLDCQSGRLRVGRHLIRDVHPIKKEKITLRDVLVQSSNVCMAQLGERMGREHLHASLKTLGFGEKTGVELRGEAKGILRAANSWRRIDVATASFGQGLAASALQLLRAYSVLANGGYLVEPRLVSDNSNYSQRRRVMSESTTRKISQMIAGVVHDEHGTARRAKISGVTVYGKTGTAQKPSTTSRGYDPDAVLSSFIGYVDGQEVGLSSKLVLYVAVDEPQVRPRWGGRVAAPVFKRSMERILSHLISTQATVAARALEKDRRIAYQDDVDKPDSVS